MPKHNSLNLEENLEVWNKTEKNIKSEIVPIPNADPKSSKIVSLREATVNITGKYSGQEYLFPKAGFPVDVDNKDVEWILSLRQGKACCGGGGGNALFQLAGE